MTDIEPHSGHLVQHAMSWVIVAHLADCDPMKGWAQQDSHIVGYNM